jgi:outer membrane protein assembly factor BamB
MKGIKLCFACIVLFGLHAEVWINTAAPMAAESTENCLLLEDFEAADWKSGWENNRPSVSSLRCTLGAHDGNYGLLNFGRWYYNPGVPLSEDNTRLGAWVFFPKSPSVRKRSASLGFSATEEGTLAFRLTADEAQLVQLSNGYKGQTEAVLHTQPFAATPGEWYRIELDFPSLTGVRARVFDESAHLLLDTSIRDLDPFSAGVSFSATFARMDSLSVCNDGAQPSWRFPPLWQTISGDFQRTGQRALDVQVDAPVEESWTFSLDQLGNPPTTPCPPDYDQQPGIDTEVIYSSPAVSGDGKVFFGSVMNCPVQSGFNAGDGWFYALDQCTGELLWSQNMHGWVESSPALSHDNRVVYVGSKSGLLTAMDTRTGEKIWEFPTGAGITASPAVDNKGTIYIGSLDGSLYAVRPDGTLKWAYDAVPPDGSIHATPALSEDERTVYFGYAHVCGGPGQDACPDPYLNFFLAAVNTATGKLRWQFPIDGQIWGSPTVSPYDASIVFPTFNSDGPNYVYSVSPAGDENWAYQIDSFANGIPSVGPDGTVYVGEFARGSLYAINPDGTLKWQFTLAGNLNYQSSIALINGGGTVVFGTYGNQQLVTGKVYALDADDMSVQWVYDAGNVVQASVAVSPDGQIFFGDWNGVQHSIGETDRYLCQ